MEKFENFNSKRFLILVLIICIIFIILIIRAFEYVPENQAKNISRGNIENINKTAVSETPKDENTSGEDISEETSANTAKNSKKELNITLPNYNDEMENIEEFPEDIKSETAGEATAEKVELTPDEQAEQILANVKKLKKEKQYKKALDELQTIKSITSNTELQATAYEETALIYAIVKHYGTALSYAQKAFNLSPSSSREMLLARLYYKTGDMDKATRRVNNVLQRDFSQDRN